MTQFQKELRDYLDSTFSLDPWRIKSCFNVLVMMAAELIKRSGMEKAERCLPEYAMVKPWE